MTQIKFVYFDIGGVLLDFDQVFVELGKIANKPAALAREAHYLLDHDVCSDRMSVEEYWTRFQEHMGAKIEIPKRIDEYFVDYFFPITATHKLAEDLTNMMRVGLLSNMWGRMFPLMKRKTLIPAIAYDVEIVSNELKVHKPQQEIFEIAEDRSGAIGEELILIDDSKGNVNAAIEFGWQGFVFDTNNPDDSVKKLREMLF